MQLIKWTLITVVLAVLFWLAGMWFLIEVKEPVWDQKRVVHYGFELKNTSADVKKDIVFKTYAPVSITSTQQVVNIDSSVPFEIIKDELNNQVLVFQINHLPPFGISNIGVTVELLLSSVVAQNYEEHPLYVSSQPLIETDDVVVKQLASLIEESEVEKPYAIYDWLVDNIEYSGYGSTDKGAVYAVDFRQGDCTEFAYLGTALGRLMDIPSRAVNGYVVNNDSKLNISNYHSWTEMWFDGGWQVIDAQAQNYMTDQQDYLAMSIYRELEQQQKEFEQFWISDTDLQVRMK